MTASACMITPIVSLWPGGTMPKYFPFVDLESGIRDSSSPEYAQVGAFMRPGKILTYVGRSQRTLSAMIRLMVGGGVSTGRGPVAPASPDAYEAATNGQTGNLAAPDTPNPVKQYFSDLGTALNNSWNKSWGEANLTNNSSAQTSEAQQALNEVVLPAQWLASLKDSYRAGSSVLQAPPAVRVNLAWLSFTAVVIACEITWKGPWYHTGGGSPAFPDGEGAYPGQADVSITFSEVSTS
jgi:hypothetical protein